MIPNDDPQTIEDRLSRDYKRVFVPSTLPGDRMVLYSPSRKEYLIGALVENCDLDTREPTSISYIAQKGGCRRLIRPEDLPQMARDGIEIQFYRSKNVLDELVIMGKTVKDPREAKVIIWCDNHGDYPGTFLYGRINAEYLKNGDTMLWEAPEEEDEIVEMHDGRKIVLATWDNAELREKFTEAARQLRRVEGEMQKNPEKASALEEELQGCEHEFYRLSLERSKCLAAAIKKRTAPFPDHRLSVIAGKAHILLEEERKVLNLDQYPHVVFISRYSPRVLPEASDEYERKILGSESKTEDTTD